MSGFIEWLGELSRKDTRIKAVLRRSLAFEPGAYPSAYPYVEPFVKGEENGWRREVHYLVAGLWAQQGKGEGEARPETLAKACSCYCFENEKQASFERRFIALLDADEDQLAYRLRQMTALLKDYPLDFSSLLNDLIFWSHEKKWVQNKWAKEFYRNWNPISDDDDTQPQEEVK